MGRPHPRETPLLRLSRSRLAPLLSAALFVWLAYLVLLPLSYNELDVFDATRRMQVLFGAAALAYLAHLAWHRRLPGPTRLDWPLLGVIAAYGVAIALSIYPRFSLEAAVVPALAVFTFYMLSDLEEVTPRAMVRGLAAVGLAGAVLALWDAGEEYASRLSLLSAVAGGVSLRDIVPPAVPRVEGVGDHVNMIALAFNITLPFVLLLALQGDRTERLVARAGAGVMLLALFLTLSRGAWVSAAIALPLFAVLYRLHGRASGLRLPRPPSRLILAGAALSMLAVAVAAVLVASRWESRPQWLFRSSLSPRYDAFEVGLEIARDEPFTGAGPNSYSLLYNVYSGDYPIENFHPHNGYLAVVVDAGLLGAAAVGIAALVLVLSLVRVFRQAPAGSRAMAAACMSALAALAVHGVFDMPNQSKTALLLLAAVSALASKLDRPGVSPRVASTSNIPRLAMLAFVPLALAGWLWTDRGHAAYDDSLADLARGDFDRAAREALWATERDPDYAAYHLHAGVVQTIAYFVHNNRGDPLPALLDGGIASLERSLELEPRGGIAHINLALALQARNERERAVEHAALAVFRAPGDGTIAGAAGTIFEWAGRREEAIDAYARAVTHDASLIESRFWDTTPFRREVRSEVIARTFLTDCRKARVVALYYAYPQDDLAALTSACRRLVERWPSDARARSDLAIALQSTGAREEALAHARRAVAQEPDNAYARTALGFALLAPDTAAQARRELALGLYLGDPDAAVLLHMYYQSSQLSPDREVPEEVLDRLDSMLATAAPFVYEGGRQQYLLGILYYRPRYFRESPVAILIPSGPDGWLALSSPRAERIEAALRAAGRR
ncbi:MAG TPA: O-antigen ligase family protein [Dehalococcoidia bacterium]|nr:O-antigen ligase family protein [Dehalococcoidia bacterium]